NGLLLILAMQDRKSRFEVGYGLEGDLTDALTRRALDDVLRPYMRQGEVKTAVVKSFAYLAGSKSGDPAFAGDMTLPATSAGGEAESELMTGRGLGVYALYF